jgi:hypothetical protein
MNNSMRYFLAIILFSAISILGFSQTDTLRAVYSGRTSATTKIAGDMDSIGDGAYRAFVKFDLSGLPAYAVITNATLNYYNYGGGGSTLPNTIFPLSNDPSSATPSVLYSDCGDVSPGSGNMAALAWGQLVPSIYSTSLTSAGISFLNSRIGTWAGIALKRDTGGTLLYYFKGYTDTINPPKLILDYFVPTACNAAPIAGSVTASNNIPCDGEPVTLTLNGTSISSGIVFQWQMTTIGGTTWSNISGATSKTYAFTATVNQEFRCMVTCLNTSDSANSDTMSIRVGGITTFPYKENFETSGGGWRGVDLGSGLQEWVWGTPAKTNMNAAANGLKCWVTNLSTDYTDLSDYALESPCIDFTNIPRPKITFSMRFLTEVDYDGLTLETSINGGNSWTKVSAANIIFNTYNSTSTIGIFNPPAWSGNNGGWLRYVVSLPSLGGSPTAKFRIHFQSDNFVTDEGVGFDSVSITNTVKDVSLTALVSPVSSCSFSSSNIVKITLTNFGTTLPVGTQIPVAYELNGGSTKTDTITLSALKLIGDTVQFSFSATVSMPAFGTYDFKVWAFMPGDSDRTNDTLFKTVSIRSVSAFPYRENFEDNDGGWVNKTFLGSFNDFVWGTPAKAFISGAASGTKCWVTKTVGNYDALSNYVLESPCINLSTAIAPTLSFSLKFSTELNYDGCILEMDTNGGTSWFKITNFVQGGYNNTSTFGALAPPQWSGKSFGWQRVKVPLSAFVGRSDVKFRFHFASDDSFNDEGVAIDSISITDLFSRDMGVSALLSPIGGCGLTSTTPLMVKIKNYGKPLAAGTKIPVEFKMVDFNNIVVASGKDTLALTAILKINDSLNFTFTTTLNLATAGYYVVKCWTGLANDSDNTNDTLFNGIIISRASVTTYPYFENFESTNGNWYSEALDGLGANEWDWNFPSKPVISFTPDGQQCWLTNPFNNYANNSNNAFYSPCFDFSSMVNPEISFLMRFKMEPNNDAMVLERSINGGASWQRVDSTGMQARYNNTSPLGGIKPPKWSGDNQSWQRYTISLADLALQSNVQFRFHFFSNGSINNEGAAIDSVVIFDNIINDLAVSAIISPISKCELTDSETVSILIKNVGNIQAPAGTAISVAYIINNGATVLETFTLSQNLPVNAIVNYDFTVRANLSVGSSFNFTAYTAWSSDYNYSNDTIANYIVAPKSIISTYPYSESFSLNTTEWTSTGGIERWKITNTLTNPVMTAHSGSYMAVFNADSFANNAVSKLTSPCLDFTSLNTHATLSFYVTLNNLSFLNQDSLNVLVSTTNGAVWTKLKGITRYNVTYTSPQWCRVDIDISSYAGQPKVLIAFEAIGKQGTRFAIDDISIYNTGIRNTPGVFSATAPCPIISGAQWIDLRDDSNNLVAQLNPNGNNLGTLCYGVNIVKNTLRYERVGAYPNKTDNYYFVRNLWLQSTLAPLTPVGMRMYYDSSEFILTRDSINNRMGTSISIADLALMNYYNAVSPTDMDLLNNDYATGIVSFATKTDTAVNGFNYISFNTTNLGELSLVYRKLLTGISKYNTAVAIRVYPNPARNKVNIEISNSTEKAGAVLYDMTGKQMALKEFISTTSFDISNISSGIYFVEIKTKEGSTRTKIIKE